MKKNIINNKPKEQVILSIDGATKTGYAIYKNGEIIEHGTERFTPSKRIYQYGNWLVQMIDKWQITHIAAEDIYREHSRTRDNAFYVLAKMQGVLEYIAFTNGVELTLLNPLQVKSKMIPSFRKKYSRDEDKQRMINRIKRLGYQLETDKADDEADAIGILITYLDNRNFTVTHPSEK